MTKTADYEELKYFTNEKPQIVENVDMYFHYIIHIRPLLDDGEMNDAEMLSLPEKVGMFSFLNNDEENIYSGADGSPLE